jgi:hypothetical protein
VKQSSNVSAVALATALVAGMTASAQAGLTPIETDGFGHERCLIGSCTDSSYTGKTSILGLIHDYDHYDLTRVDDGGDQQWTQTASPSGLVARARYAGNKNKIGFLPGTSGGSFDRVLTAPEGPAVFLENNAAAIGDGEAVSDDIKALSGNWVPFDPGAAFRLAIKTPGTSGTVFSSRNGDNGDGLDHMVTWLVATGGASQETIDGQLVNILGRYIIAFEDLSGPLGPGSDRDFNDVVIEVVNVAPVPLPGAAWLFGSGVLGLLGIGYSRKRKAAA